MSTTLTAWRGRCRDAVDDADDADDAGDAADATDVDDHGFFHGKRSSKCLHEADDERI